MRVFEPGDLLSGRYRIDRQIGAGGMGSVYLAQHTRLEVPVAVKTCHLGLNISPSEIPGYLKRFKREALALTKLKHTNIVSVLDYDVVDDTPFLVMEYFKGLSVLGWGDEKKPSPKQWFDVFKPLFEALAVAHRAGIVHRDIKGPNVLVRGDIDSPEVMLIDWGVAFDESMSGLTQQDAVVGSPGCIDPARYFGASYTPQSDVYSMGALMYWALTGEPAIVPRDGQSKHEANAQNRVVPPHEVNPKIVGDLEEFLLAMLETEPDNRPPSALACAAILDALQNDREVDWETIYARYPKKPFVAAADLDEVVDVSGSNRFIAQTQRLKPQTPSEGHSNVAEVSIPSGGAVRVDVAPKAQPSVSPAKQFEGNLAQLGMVAKGKRRIGAVMLAAVGLSALAAALFLIAPSARLSNPTPEPLSDSTLGQLVTPEDIERASKKTPPALEQILSGRVVVDNSGGNEQRLDRFDPNIRARYETTINQPKAASTGPAETSIAKPSKPEQQPTKEEPAVMNLGIVPLTKPTTGKEQKSEQLSIPHGTRIAAHLLDLLDTSSGEAVRAELRSSLRVDDKVVIPVGSVLIGRASLHNALRATASFNRVVFRDGREFPIRASAVLKDGREGIAGGQFEYGDVNKKNDGARIVSEVAGEVALDVASVVLPGADAFSRSGKNAIAREGDRARDRTKDQPSKRDRMLVNRDTEVLIRFETM